MTIDEQIRSDMKTAASVVSLVPITPIDQIRRRGQARRIRRRVVWGLGSALLLVVALALTVPFDPNRIDPADSYQIDTVEVADLAVPVVDEEPALTGPDVWIGLPGPTPSFDTSNLGPDLSFRPGRPPGDVLSDRVIGAVYLGEFEGEPFYLYSTAAPSIWDRIFEVLDGNFSGDVLGTTLNCCSGGDMDQDEGLPGFSQSWTTGEPALIVAEWLGLPPDVSVVAFEVDGAPHGWQRPIGGAVSIRLDESPEEVGYVAFDRLGEEVLRFGPLELGLPEELEDPTGASTSDPGWAPLESEGREIGAEDLPNELRSVIDLRAGDRAFVVVAGEGDLFVVVRADRSAHAYATSCDLLGSVDLPSGWEGTCLEKAVDGVREKGVFDYRELSEAGP